MRVSRRQAGREGREGTAAAIAAGAADSGGGCLSACECGVCGDGETGRQAGRQAGHILLSQAKYKTGQAPPPARHTDPQQAGSRR